MTRRQNAQEGRQSPRNAKGYATVPLIALNVTSDRGVGLEARREHARIAAEREALQTLENLPHAWYRAAEVSENCKLRWRICACALRRLARKGFIDERVISVPGKCRSWEQTRIYGVMRYPEMPSIFAPFTVHPIVGARLVKRC